MTFNTFAEKNLCSYNFLLADGGLFDLDSACRRTTSLPPAVTHGRESVWLNVKGMRIWPLGGEEGA